MCPKKQLYHHKNVCTVFIVKFEFLGSMENNSAKFHCWNERFYAFKNNYLRLLMALEITFDLRYELKDIVFKPSERSKRGLGSEENYVCMSFIASRLGWTKDTLL